jgi:uncharacterized sulfatase
VEVPSFLPDTDEVQSDLLDYALEIEWFDYHLGKMLDLLEEAGELDNTIIVVTSDNGMAFPRAKANLYEYGFHVPLAIRWGEKMKCNCIAEDVVSLIDLAPTYLEAANVKHPSETNGLYPIEGRSLMSILRSEKEGMVDDFRNAAYAARERHSSSRWNNLTYPQRSLRTSNFYISEILSLKDGRQAHRKNMRRKASWAQCMMPIMILMPVLLRIFWWSTGMIRKSASTFIWR